MSAHANGDGGATLEARLRWLAWRWYRIPRAASEDIVQATLVTDLERRARDPLSPSHPAFLVGIHRNKCREYIAGRVRAQRGFQAACAATRAGEVKSKSVAGVRPAPSALEALVEREKGRGILRALSEQRPRAREMFRLIAEEGATRKDLIQRYGLNKNTLDSRLRTYRGALRKTLARHGVQI